MTLQDRGLQLIGYLTQLSSCVDICCDCVSFSPTLCECISGGTSHPDGVVVPANLAITIPGDMSACELEGGPTCGPVAGYNFAGTYFVTCDDDVIGPSAKTQLLHRELTFVCTDSGSDYYVQETLTLQLWQIATGTPGVYSFVQITFNTARIEYTAGDDPDIDTPLSSVGAGGVAYTYQLTTSIYTDECGSVHQKCGDYTLVSTFVDTSFFGGCSHSNTDQDFRPTVVRLGTP